MLQQFPEPFCISDGGNGKLK